MFLQMWVTTVDITCSVEGVYGTVIKSLRLYSNADLFICLFCN